MARVILVTGGSRSGKSDYAQGLAESMAETRTYIATCPVLDEEMAERIRKHRERRDRGRWRTIEEQADVVAALDEAQPSEVILLDCLTLWVNNLLYEAEQGPHALSEEEIARRCREILAFCEALPGVVIFVTNEVGLGIVPDNPASRRYRDLVGRCNQVMAAGAEAVILVVCGIPLFLKGNPSLS